jgi:arylsulfatase A-like enzyme
VLKPWDQLSADEKKLFIRQVEVFAAYAAYSDHEIGRVIQAFQDLGKLDNTLIIYINGDNGTSAEGGPMGTPNEVAFFNGLNELPVDVQMKWYDVWGTEQTYNHMSAGWSWAFDTPFDWFKQNASRLGGINQNMVVSWPARIKDKGGPARAVRARHRRRADHPRSGGHQGAGDGRRHQAGADRGHQLRLHLRRGQCQGASRHKTQYFEMMGQWALYDDGWLLSTKVNRAPWQAFGAANPDPLNNQVFQLYNLGKDFNQTDDIAAQNPQKVKEMRQKFLAEAKKHQVLPLDASVAARIVAPRPNITAGRTNLSTRDRWSACRRATRRSC